MTFKTPLFALALVGLTSPAFAETDCTSEWVLIKQIISAQADAAHLDDGQCVVQNIKWPDGSQATSFGWTIPELTQAALEGRVPQSAAINFVGMIESNPTQDLGALAGKPVDVSVSYSWDATSREMNIAGISVAFEDGQGVQIQGKVTGLDLSSAQMTQISAMQAALTDLDVQISGDDVLAAILNPALDELAKDDASSAASPSAAELKAAHDFVDQLPQASFGLGTRLALKSLVAALPEPQDGVRLTMTSETGLSAIRLMPLMMQDDPAMADILSILFEGATVNVSYPWSAE